MPRRREKPRGSPGEQAVRGRIVAGARRHFFAHGFRGVTMDDLATELGMSKKTLYAHFRSKTALVEAAILEKLASLEAELGQIEAECPADFPEALRRLLSCVQRHTEEIQPPFLRDIQREAPELFAMVQTRRAALIQRYFGKLFTDGRKAGMVRKDVPAQLVVEVLLGAIQAVVNPRKLGELGLNPQTGFSAIISVILTGVLTADGRAKR
jgi:TetR/AcrR family transcriptional regulator, cholesterol catabolism regulator